MEVIKRCKKKPSYYEDEDIEKQQQNSSWINNNADQLPQDVLSLIHNKLSYIVDRVHFRAVCKSWRIPNDMIIDDPCINLPWSFSYSWLPKEVGESLTFECLITEPFLNQNYRVYNSVRVDFKTNYSDIRNTVVYATLDGGWALVGWVTETIRSFFIHNVFTNQLITPPHLFDNPCVPFAATFLNDHTELFVLFYDSELRGNRYYTATFCDQTWSTAGVVDDLNSIPAASLMDAQYIKGHGKVYFLYRDGSLRSYIVGARSSELVVLGSFLDISKCWLVENDGELIMVVKKSFRNYIRNHDQWLIFKFDWSRKCWINETNVKNNASLTKTASSSSLSTALVEENNTRDFRISFTGFEYGDFVTSCYSMTQKKLLISKRCPCIMYFRRTSFIQFPY